MPGPAALTLSPEAPCSLMAVLQSSPLAGAPAALPGPPRVHSRISVRGYRENKPQTLDTLPVRQLQPIPFPLGSFSLSSHLLVPVPLLRENGRGLRGKSLSPFRGLLYPLQGWPRSAHGRPAPHWAGLLETVASLSGIGRLVGMSKAKEEQALAEFLALPWGAFLHVGRPLASVWVATVKVQGWC